MISWAEVNKKIILKVIGFLLVIEGLFMFAGIPVSIFYQEPYVPFIISGSLTALTGLFFWSFSRNDKSRQIGKREGYIIVSTAWLIISLFGTLPFILSDSITHFTDAFFETISGFTTTGATIITDIEVLPKGVLFWRSLTQWIGGMGIIVLSIAVLPFLGIGGMQLFVAEVPGITPDKLHPRITATAKRLWLIYVLLTVVEALILFAGDMDLFDALCHSFTTMATGGFSTQNDSIAGYSPYVQYVITFFMFAAGTNFTLHYLSLHGNFRGVWRNEEFRYYTGSVLIIGLVLAVLLLIFWDTGPEKSFRDSIFQTVSIITTTGFITADYSLWPGFLWFIIFILMFVGGSAGSTGGGIKVVRQLLLFKNGWMELKRLVHPHAVIPVRFNAKPVPQNIIFKVMAFFLFYLNIFAFGSLVMAALGLDYESAIGAAAATLGNIGPGIGSVGPVNNFAHIPGFGKWFLSFLMVLGRLELFTVLILFSPAFWRK